MKRNRKITVVAAVAVAGAVVAGATHLAASAGQSTTYKREIYKLVYTDPSAKATINEWASLATGVWREDVDDQSFIADSGSYAVIDHDSGSVYRRTGSPDFIGVLNETPTGVLALKAYLKGDTTLSNHGIQVAASTMANGKTKLTATDAQGQVAFYATIEGKLSDEEAESSHVLEAAPVAPQVVDREMAVGNGSPAGIRAWWLGRTFNGLHVQTGVEHVRGRTAQEVASGMSDRGDVHTVVLLYERPGQQVTSATPGPSHAPAGEVQVSSEPLNTGHAQALVRAFNGTNGDETYPAFPRTAVALANGEAADAIPDLFEGDTSARHGFFVVTADSLISVNGDFSVDDLGKVAAQLRPM
jgi:hypothetical protein